eukprot:m.56678 g.56678  ORF g.56678 m.56678 type:complete len:53 (-) comp7811_c0_seq1:2453-2611(-)
MGRGLSKVKREVQSKWGECEFRGVTNSEKEGPSSSSRECVWYYKEFCVWLQR